MIKDAGDVAPYRLSDTSPVLERQWFEKIHGQLYSHRLGSMPDLTPRLLLMRAITMVEFVHVHLLKNTPSITNRCCSLIPPATTSDSRGTYVTVPTVSSGYRGAKSILSAVRCCPSFLRDQLLPNLRHWHIDNLCPLRDALLVEITQNLRHWQIDNLCPLRDACAPGRNSP